MKRLSVLVSFLVTFVLLSACSVPSAPQATLEPEARNWQQFGGSVATGTQVSLAQTVAGIPVMAYAASDGTSTNIYVKRWDGNSWVQLGGILDVNVNQNARSPSLALDSSGNPVVGWSEYDGTKHNRIYVKRWNGSGWVQLGTNLDQDTSCNHGAYNPSLALDSSGNPTVSWDENCGLYDAIYAKRWNGSSWQSLDDDFSMGISSPVSPSLSLTSSGNPVVAWQECSSESSCGTNNIYVKRWTGSAWVEYGTGGPLDINVGMNAYEPSLALDSNNNPVVAWYEELGGNSLNVYVKRWNGTAWVQYGTGGPLDITPFNTAYGPSLALDSSGNPRVAWTEYGTSTYNIYVKQWTGSAWTLVGTNPLSSTTLHANYSSLSMVNGKLSVAWSEGVDPTPSYTDNLYVKQYLTNAWQDMGGALDVQVGKFAVNSSIARKSNNLPVVAWEETDPNNGSRNVYVKSWTGSAWSLLGGALDRTLTNAANLPSLALRSNQPVVAFQEANNVYVRRWNNATSAWVNVSNSALDTVLANPAAEPSLAIGTDNLPVVAYAESSSILVKKANGVVGSSSWLSPYGTTPLDINALNIAAAPTLALKSDNNPIVAWGEASPSFNVRVKEWNGSSWVALGGSLNTSASNNAADITVAIRSDNRPVVAWQEAGNIYVKRWDGSSWLPLGTVLDTVPAHVAVNPSLDLRSDDNPVVTWSEDNGSGTNFNVFVKRWTGSSWVAVGSAVDRVISQTTGSPSLVLKSNNNPIVSWEEFDGSSNNIYVRQY